MKISRLFGLLKQNMIIRKMDFMYRPISISVIRIR